MNALQSPRSTPRPVRHLQVVRKAAPPQKRQPHRVVAVETTAKLAVNVLLSVAAVTTLVQLLPYSMSQQAKLEELQAEVKTTEKRVDRLQADFNRQFDPSQAHSIMQEQSARVDAQRRQIHWLEPNINPAGMAQSP
jgi:Tfp pilus assembly protein FimV